MEHLESDFSIRSDEAEELALGFKCRGSDALRHDDVRDRLASGGYKPRMLAPETSSVCFLAGDCSSAVRELRYNALWAAHAVAVYAIFDGGEHRDMLAGYGSIPYGSLRYSNYAGLGEIVPYGDVEARSGAARACFEYESMVKAYRELESEGLKPDIMLFDGSLYTSRRSLESAGDQNKEAALAAKALTEAAGLGRAVGMVEDSHATDMAHELGYDFTDLLLIDVALKPGEYVADVREGVSICYLKLPGKPLPHLPSGISHPLTVRWEFGYAGYVKDLNLLAGIWLREDDILHPQLYPLRIADHLTRRVRARGILDEVESRLLLERKYRELREG